jgi:anti-sigma regulatory factor (Ser/Thr protein kinase)
MPGASTAGDSAADERGHPPQVWFTVPEPEDALLERDLARAGGGDSAIVRLEIPTQTRIVRAARLVASGLASTAGFDVDDVDDMRIAVDELCALLFELGSGGVVNITFTSRPGHLEVLGQTAASDDPVDPTRFGLSVQILNAACDEFSWAVADGVVLVRLEKSPRRRDLPSGTVVRRFPEESSSRRHRSR